jgi:hypothetical protein
MASAIAFRVILIYIFAVVGYSIIMGGPTAGINLISGTPTQLIGLIGGVLAGFGVTFIAAAAFSGVFIGAFVVIGLITVFSNYFAPALNPFAMPILNLASTAPTGLAGILTVLGLLVEFATIVISAWAIVDIFAG